MRRKGGARATRWIKPFGGRDYILILVKRDKKNPRRLRYFQSSTSDVSALSVSQSVGRSRGLAAPVPYESLYC